jgi:pimeloyl-ACP methyl ester carboxylesterase
LAANLAYEDHGGGSDLPPIVFLHGAGGNRLHWPPALRRMADARTLALDLPGHGQSPDTTAVTVDDFVARVEAWRRAVGLERMVVVGHSLGSAIALTYALELPEVAAALVLVGAGARLWVNPALLEGLADPDRWQATVDQIIRWSFAQQAAPRIVELARRRMLETDPAILRRDFQACAGFDVIARLAEIRTPTLVVCGLEDRMTPPALGEALAEGIAGARWRPISGSGHMLMLEQPAALERELRTFLLEARSVA